VAEDYDEGRDVIEYVARAKSQAPPAKIVWGKLADPHTDPHRPWLDLRPDEIEPRVLQLERPILVVWSSLWPDRPDDQIRFDLEPPEGSGCVLRWTLLTPSEPPDEKRVGQLRHRVNELINGNLRATFGQ
jgi:hypothetical protein